MTVINPPAWLQQGTYPARTDRLVMNSIVESSGVVSSTDLNVTNSATPGMTVTVSAGKAWIVGNSVSYQGVYNFVNDGDVVVGVDASHTSFSRLDRVIARVQDASVSGGVNSATIEVITGTPSSSPTLPALPSNSIHLAQVTVAPNVTTISSGAVNRNAKPIAKFYSQPSSSVFICTSTTRPGTSVRYVGMEILETDTLRNWMWNGSYWSYRGGGPAPAAALQRSAERNYPSGTQLLMNLEKVSNGFDETYYNFVNTGTYEDGDSIQVVQSGNYDISGYATMHKDTTKYYAHIYLSFSPGLSIPTSAEGSSVTSGQQVFTVTTNRYLAAGTKVRLALTSNDLVTVTNSGMSLVMTP